MNIYRQEFRMLRTSALIWFIVLVLLALIYLSIFPSFARDADTVREVFAKLPAAVRGAMGTHGFELFSFPGFFANVLPVFLLAGGIQAMNMGITMTNREKLAGTDDFLLTKPVGRSVIYFQKLLAHLTILFFIGGGLMTVIGIGGHLVAKDEFSNTMLLLVLLVFPAIQLWFLLFGSLVANALGRIRSVAGISMATVFALFILGLFGTVVGDETIRFMTPFKYFDLLAIVTTQTYEPTYLALWIGTIFVCLLISWQFYLRRDSRS